MGIPREATHLLLFKGHSGSALTCLRYKEKLALPKKSKTTLDIGSGDEHLFKMLASWPTFWAKLRVIKSIACVITVML